MNYEEFAPLSRYDHTDIYKQYLDNAEPNTLVFILDDYFYRTFDDDAKVMNEIFGYKVVDDNMVAFPITSLVKVVNKLNDSLISYHFIDGNDIKSYVNDEANQYQAHLNIYNTVNKFKDELATIEKMVRNLITEDEKNFDKILKFLTDLEKNSH